MVPMFCSAAALVRSRFLLVTAAVLTLGVAAGAQPTAVLPSTISTYAGSVPAATAVGAGKLCNGGGTPAAGNTLPVATDAVNDGCPAAQAIFSADVRAGVATDPQGNVYLFDGGNGGTNILRKIDARSGLISLFSGGAVTVCAAAVDKYGDGCPYAQTGNYGNARGIGADPFGNIVLADYGSSLVHLYCNALSPTCSSAQLGTMRIAAGCVTGAAGGSGAAGNGADNVVANPVVATCSTAVAELNQLRGASMDAYGNIFIGDTANLRLRVVLGPQTYNGVTNPLFAIIGLNPATTATAGYIYSLLPKYTASSITAGSFCSGTAGAKNLDAYGDGCPYYKAQVASAQTSVYQTTAQDAAGDLFFADYSNTYLIRVVYAGGPLAAAAITANNPTITSPVVGSVYLIAGGGGTGLGNTPLLGNVANIGSVYKMTIDPASQNLFFSYAANIVFDDLATGYVRKIGSGGTNCVAAANATGAAPDTQGDGCTALAASYGGSNGLGIAFDNLGNLYVADTTNALVRKVAAGSYGNIAAKTTFTPNYNIHSLAANGPAAVTLGPNSDFTLNAGTCAQNTTADNTYDCPNTVTFVPSAIGLRSAPTTITITTSGALAMGSVTGNSTGTALVFDTAAPITLQIGTQLAVTATALNGANNLFTANATSVTKMPLGGSATTIYTPASAPTAIAADPQGNVYLAFGTAASVVKLTFTAPSTYTAGPLTSVAANNTAFGTVKALAVDANGNVYLANSVGQVIRYTQANGQVVTLTSTQLNSVTASNVTGLALDNIGNLLIADNGAGVVYRLPVAGIATVTPAALPATVVSGVKPYAVAADAAGDVYYTDTTAKTVVMIPVTGSATTVVSGLSVPDGLALDGLGNVYIADTALTGIEKIARNAFTYAFANTSTTLAGTITNAGNTTATGYSATGLDSAEFPVTSVSPTNCFSSTAITAGLACSVTVQFSPSASGTGPVSSTLAFTPVATEFGSVVLSGVKTGMTTTTMTTIGAASPANPIYSAAGTEVTFPVTVTASDSSIPTGSVMVQVDGGNAVAYTLVNGTVSVPLAGLAAGSHAIVASYANQGGLVGSTSTTTMFSVAQAGTTTNWTPSTTAQQYSAAVGTGVLDAAAVQTGTTTPVPGFYLYTAMPSGGAATTVHSASFLPIGTYSLQVTFVPADAVDFASSTASVASYTVSKASTTAGLGATQMLVAADGTGNYTSIQAAINAISATAGGSVYIKPGTYTGDVTVVQPNVSLRGLGGDPTAVILTHAGGAFGGAGVYMYAGEFNTSQANGYQLPAGSSLFNGDEGSATLVVAKGINTAVSTATLIPNGFYGENFTLLNSYNTDTTTTTTTYLPAANSGTCTANQGPARTYNDLYNNSLECASQALAIWTTADLSVMNNIYTGSLQDTIYAGSQGSGSAGYVPARQYWFRGKVQGQVDYIFGDAAAVFDYSSIYTLPKLTSLTGTETIEAQNKANQTGGGSDYLSGYVMNSNVFTSYTAGMTGLEFGRPYGKYSTYVMLNSYVDQVNPSGYIEFSGQTNLPTSTYGEFNDLLYTDPATGAADLNGVLYTGQGGSSGAGVTGTRETTSQNPGTPEANNAVKTSLTAAQATLYYPTNFLGATVSSALSSTANFNPTGTLAANVNAFATGATTNTIVGGSSVTIVMRPQTPGLGAVTNGIYTIPTGNYTLTDTFNGATTTVASGSLDASGEAYFTSSALTVGVHSFVWTYSGDTNFSGSTAAAYALQVTGTSTTTSLSAMNNPISYGQSAVITANVAAASGTAVGTVTLTIDGTTTQTGTLAGGQYSFTVNGLQAGSHSFSASYSGSSMFMSSGTTGNLALTVNQAVLTVTASCANRAFGAQNNCSASVAGYQDSDTVATVFSGTPTGTTMAQANSPAGTYTATPANTGLTAFGSTNYTVAPVSTTFTVTGSGNAAQTIIFRALPNFPAGTYQLSARTTSGLPITYTVTGNATVSGSTLTVLAGGGTVTVTAATAVDPNGDYAAATPVARSFTAQ